MEAATKLHQQVHQCLTKIVKTGETGGREEVKGREGRRKFGRNNHRRRRGDRDKRKAARGKMGLENIPYISYSIVNSI